MCNSICLLVVQSPTSSLESPSPNIIIIIIICISIISIISIGSVCLPLSWCRWRCSASHADSSISNCLFTNKLSRKKEKKKKKKEKKLPKYTSMTHTHMQCEDVLKKRIPIVSHYYFFASKNMIVIKSTLTNFNIAARRSRTCMHTHKRTWIAAL